MVKKLYDYGMIGLGTMGRNLVYNICDHGYTVAGFDKDLSKVETLEQDKGNYDLCGRIFSFFVSRTLCSNLFGIVTILKVCRLQWPNN